MRLDKDSLACFLDKVAGNYPSGIPLAALVLERQEASITPGMECVFVLISADSSIGATHADLLNAICTKGLKFERSACDVRVVSAWSGPAPEEVAPLTVILGADRVPGTIEGTPEGKILFSHPIDSIATNASLKRDFWGHLQALRRR